MLLAQLESAGRLVPLDHLVQQGLLVNEEHWVNEVCQEQMVRRDSKDSQVTVAQVVKQESEANLEILVALDHQVYRAFEDFQDELDLRDVMANQAHVVLRELMANLENKELLVFRACQG